MTAPPAGWYTDPEDRTAQRWWDGSEWSEHRQRGRPSTPAPVGWRSTPEGWVLTVNRDGVVLKNTPATVALVFGVLCLFVNTLLFASIVAIVLAIIGRSRASGFEREGLAPVGRRTATWALVLGLVGVVFSAGLKAFLF